MKNKDSFCRHFSSLRLIGVLSVLLVLGAGLNRASSQAVEAWVQRYGSGLGSAEDSGSSIITDATGDVIVAGTSNGRMTGSDLVTTKYSGANGAILWQQRHNGPGNGFDAHGRVALDAAGNVLMVASSFGIGTGLDLYTAKYAAADGKLLWEHRYNGPGNYNDWGTGIVVDRNGNVVVTGIIAAGSSYDIYIAKHAGTDGSVLWQSTHGNSGTGDDAPAGVALDTTGNVILVGSSPDASNSESNLLTLKFAGDTGTVIWQHRSKGPAPRAMAMAPNGDLVITGIVGPGFSPDILTIRLASGTGALLWERRYDGPSYDQPNGLALDASGNVIITGQSFDRASSFNFYTAKYAAADGAVIWEQRAGGSSSAGNFAQAVAVDSRGDVVVTGELSGTLGRFDYYTIKYAGADGRKIWDKTYDGPTHDNDNATAVTVDDLDNVIVSGVSTGGEGWGDIYTAKYAANNGALIWEQRYDGPRERYDAATAAATDRDGNVIVTGTSEDGEGGNDLYTVKYAPDGNILWTHRHGPGAGFGSGNAVALALNGDVFITGSLANSNGSPDLYTARYAASNGALLWERIYDGPRGNYDSGTILAVDGHGDVIVVAESFGGSGEAAPDFYTAKYAGADGSLLWERRYDGNGADDRPAGLQVDRQGNVVVAGSSAGWEGDVDFYTAKYAAADGTLLWERRYNGPLNFSDHANALALDAQGNVLVTGSSVGTLFPAYEDFYTAKLASADGASIWEVRFDGPSHLDDEPFSITADSAGNAIVTGYSHDANGEQELYTVKYRSADGVVLWQQRYHGPGINKQNVGQTVAVDAADNAIVFGYSSNGLNTDYYTAKYAAADGALLWEKRYNGPGVGIDVPGARGLAVGPGNLVIVTGSSDYDFTTVAYRDNLPPKIRCPIALAADSREVAGASVSFVVPAIDSSGVPPLVVCTPASGSQFPLGQTVVHCTATDEEGLTTQCAFTITVRGAHAIVADVRSNLVSALNSIAESDQRPIKRAVQELAQALSSGLWLDENHIVPTTGSEVFQSLRQAAQSLCSTSLATEAERLTKASRLLADVAIHEAPSDSGNRTDQARKALGRGDGKIDGRRCGQGIEDYRTAWEQVNRASTNRTAQSSASSRK